MERRRSNVANIAVMRLSNLRFAMKDIELEIKGLINPIEIPLKELTARLLNDFEGNILGICVVGSAITTDFVAHKSRINTVLIFEEDTIEVLSRIGAMGKLFKKYRFDLPLIMTKRHIERSCDVFGVEYLDIALSHKLIWGQSPFEDLKIDKADVRLQCERELKADIIRLRQGFIASKFTPIDLIDILTSCASGILPYLRAILWLCDKQRCPLALPTIKSAADLLGFDDKPLAKLVGWKHKKPRADSSEQIEAVQYLYSLAVLLSGWVDEYDVLSAQ